MSKQVIMIANGDDRMKVVCILAANGYTVRVVRIKDGAGKMVGAVEYWRES